ncbi:hypothetical protein [Virgibacillus sp. L01]|uniref:hypothetical protein n=1 Tax=Virgibacillus sp. L01 TaxID=3457429 RepID=UPI003FD5E311
MLKTLSKSNARKVFSAWEQDKIPRFECEGETLELREKLIESSDRVLQYIEENEAGTNKKDYLYDLRFGIELYLLLGEKYNFNLRQASDDEVWIYLSIKVIPDLVYNRWGLSESRFYKQSRRIWLRTMWWYVHLSWADTYEQTYDVLKGFTTDEVVQLVERSGPHGYRIDVTREIMKQFSDLTDSQLNRNLFRKVMKLNTARTKIIEPFLFTGGTNKYVEELITYFDEADGSEKTKQTKDTIEYSHTKSS